MIGGPSDVVVEPNIVRAVGRARSRPRGSPRLTPSTAARACRCPSRRLAAAAGTSRRLAPTPRRAPIGPAPTEEPWPAAASRRRRAPHARARDARRPRRRTVGAAGPHANSTAPRRAARAAHRCPPPTTGAVTAQRPQPRRHGAAARSGAAPHAGARGQRVRRSRSAGVGTGQCREQAPEPPRGRSRTKHAPRGKPDRVKSTVDAEDRTESRARRTKHRADRNSSRGDARQEPVRQSRTGDGELARPSPGKDLTGAVRPPRPSCDGGGRSSGLIIALAATPAGAQDISINFGQGSGLTERVIQLIALLTVLSLAPSILVMMTSFTRIVVVLSLLRTALGTATAPPNAVIISLALFLTAFVMGPALQQRLRRRRQAADRQRDHRRAGVRARARRRCTPSCRRTCATRI